MATVINLALASDTQARLITETSALTTAQVSLDLGFPRAMLSYTTVINAGATGSASCILEGSLDGSNWVTIQTVTQTGGAGSAATTGTTTAKPYAFIRHNVNPNTGQGSTVETLAMPQ